MKYTIKPTLCSGMGCTAATRPYIINVYNVNMWISKAFNID